MIVVNMAVLLAAIAAFIFSVVWFSIFGKKWMLARGWKNLGRRTVPFSSMLAIFIVQFVMALVLVNVLAAVAGADYGWKSAVSAAALLWIGFTLAPLFANGLFSHTRFIVTVIESVHWLGVMFVESVILGLLR